MKNIHISLILFASFNSVIAQIPGGTKIKKAPSAFEEPRGMETYDNGKTGTLDWIVYSDRDNNKTYIKPTADSEAKGTVQFMDKFYVIDDKGDFLSIVKYDSKMAVESSKSSRTLKKEAVYLGWIKKTHVLLWSSALYNEKSIKIKALPAIRGEMITNPENYIKSGGLLMLYNSPDLSKQNNQQVRMFQFLYVYKRSSNKYLVGKSDIVNAGNADKNILGWVDEKIVQIWGDRVCLEPNWDPVAAEERRNKKIKASLFLNTLGAQSYSKTGKSGDTVWAADPYEHRKKPEWKRFPILGDVEGVIETGVLDDIVDNKGNHVVNLDEQADANKVHNDKIAEMRHVNIVFVIDGGSGMNEYMPPLMKAIERIKDQNNNSDIKSQINYGVVFFRDYSDASCSGGDISVAKSNLNSDIQSIFNFLATESQVQSCAGTANTQAVRLGIYKGLQMLDDKNRKEQSNLLVLIGGEGDNLEEKKEPKYSTDQLAKMMADVQAHFIVFQVNNGNSAGFRSFVGQNRTLFMKTANNMKLAMEQNRKLDYLGKKISPEWVESMSDNVYRIDHPRTSGTLGTIIFPDAGKFTEPAYLTTEVNNMLDTILNIIEYKIQKLSSLFDGIGEKDITNLNPSVMIMLHSMSMSEKLPAKVLKEYKNHNYQFFINAFTTIECAKLEHPVYKRVLFINEDEFESLRSRLNLLSVDDNDGEAQRRKLVAAFNQILATYLGDKEAKNAINKMTTEQILALVTGLKSSNPIFKKYKVNDIMKKEKVSREELVDMVDYLRNKAAVLGEIKYNEQYLFKQYSMVYYWIPEELLP